MTTTEANNIARSILDKSVKPSQLADVEHIGPNWYIDESYRFAPPYSQTLFDAVSACDHDLRLRLCAAGNVMVACHIAHTGDVACEYVLARSESDNVRRHVANATADDQTLDILALDENEDVLMNVLSHERQKDATTLSTHHSTDIRVRVAEFADDPSTIERLAHDKHAEVRAEIAARGLMLDELEKDRAESVLEVVVKATAEKGDPVPDRCMTRLAKSKNWRTRSWVASGEYARHADAVRGLSDKDRWVRYWLAYCTTYQDVLDALKSDADAEIRDIAIDRDIV